MFDSREESERLMASEETNRSFAIDSEKSQPGGSGRGRFEDLKLGVLYLLLVVTVGLNIAQYLHLEKYMNRQDIGRSRFCKHSFATSAIKQRWIATAMSDHFS